MRLVLSTVLFLALSCSSPVRRTEAAYPDGKPKVEVEYEVSNGKEEKRKVIEYYPASAPQGGTSAGKPAGNIRYEGEFRNDKRNGKWTYYFENGNKWSEGYFTDDQSDGKISVWHESGKIRYEGYFEMGKKSGKWRFYNEDGTLSKEESYD